MTMQIGSYLFDREQQPLSADEVDIVRRFHELYYRRWMSGNDTINLSWFGYQVLKCPLDLWMYQELLVRTRPDVVVETGTWRGGSALYIAMVLDQIGHGRVISVDLDPKPGLPEHPRITFITGSSTDPTISTRVYDSVAGGRTIVILDSDHSAAHVYNEIVTYSPLVWVGDHLIVEDTDVNGNPILPDFGPGPMEAVTRFLSETSEFAVDRPCERFLMTLNPSGYLKRVRSRQS